MYADVTLIGRFCLDQILIPTCIYYFLQEAEQQQIPQTEIIDTYK